MAVTFHLLKVCKCRVTNLQAYLLQTLIENKQSLTKATSAIQLLFITKFHSISFQLSGSIFFRVAIINTFKVTDSISIPDDYSIFFQDDSNISFRYDASISFHDDSQFLVQGLLGPTSVFAVQHLFAEISPTESIMSQICKTYYQYQSQVQTKTKQTFIDKLQKFTIFIPVVRLRQVSLSTFPDKFL